MQWRDGTPTLLSRGSKPCKQQEVRLRNLTNVTRAPAACNRGSIRIPCTRALSIGKDVLPTVSEHGRFYDVISLDIMPSVSLLLRFPRHKHLQVLCFEFRLNCWALIPAINVRKPDLLPGSICLGRNLLFGCFK